MVKNNGVRAFVLESDFGGGAIVNDYVLGRGGKLEDVVKNLDFAIAERPRQAINIDKKVSGVKVVLANGSEMINAKVVEDENNDELPF